MVEWYRYRNLGTKKQAPKKLEKQEKRESTSKEKNRQNAKEAEQPRSK